MSRIVSRYLFHDLIPWDRVVGYNERSDGLTPCYELILAIKKSDRVKFRKDRVRLPYNADTQRRYSRDRRYKDQALRKAHLQQGKYARNILSVPSLRGSSKEKAGHPAQKPLALIKQLVILSTDRDDVVLDPFAGAGTTAVAAKVTGRRWISIEKDPKYCRIAAARVAKSAIGNPEDDDQVDNVIGDTLIAGCFPVTLPRNRLTIATE